MEQTQSNLNIGTIGQKLESARQAKGVSVSEAGRATKILSKFIEAMEADDFGALSAPVYARSFIKMYAQYLGLDGSPLVAEYVAQHSATTLPQLSDEVRQNLASVDHVPVDSNGTPTGSGAGSGKKIFSEVNDALLRLSGSGVSPKVVTSVVGGIVLVLLIVFSVSQCADDEAEAPAAGSAAMVECELIADGAPDVYLVRPGVVEVERN
jgi:uncharacterized membrane protein YdcZ (DUF606 family)